MICTYEVPISYHLTLRRLPGSSQRVLKGLLATSRRKDPERTLRTATGTSPETLPGHLWTRFLLHFRRLALTFSMRFRSKASLRKASFGLILLLHFCRPRPSHNAQYLSQIVSETIWAPFGKDCGWFGEGVAHTLRNETLEASLLDFG